MQIGRGILDAFEAIPDRIEVSGHEPTWRVTGGSFDSVVEFVREAYDEATVVAREDRSRWWPRVTLTVTTDPGLAAAAPPWDSLVDPTPPEPAPTTPEPEPEPGPAAGLEPVTNEPVADEPGTDEPAAAETVAASGAPSATEPTAVTKPAGSSTVPDEDRPGASTVPRQRAGSSDETAVADDAVHDDEAAAPEMDDGSSDERFLEALEEIFSHQEAVARARAARRRIPRQRR